jgi:hypothetical protein
MRSKRYRVEQIVAKLREAEKLQAQGLTIPQACKRLGWTGSGLAMQHDCRNARPDPLPIRVYLAGLRKAGYDIGEFTRVGRKYNMPGGGSELRFEKAIPARFVKVVRR